MTEEYDDLAPRELDPITPRRRRRWLPIVLIGLVLVAGGVIVTQFLRSAIDYYCNVDEVGARDGCEADRRLRVQGVVAEGSVASEGAVTNFVIEFGGEEMPVRYDGAPGGIFQECIPVVVHGELDGNSGTFHGDRVEVKHSDEYVAVNDDRLDEADEYAESLCSA